MNNFQTIIKYITSKNFLVLTAFLTITALGIYLRFWNIQYVQGFGWDQARDAWKVRDLLSGAYPFEGPKTGIGQFHLGPLHYYFMAPFFLATQLDPMAANYYNITLNLITFTVIFLILRSIFNTKTALIGLFLYAVSHYINKQNIIPWNVSLLPITAFLSFWLIIQIVIKEKYKYIPLLAATTGFFFHVHFTAVFMIPIIILSLLLVKDKVKALKFSLLGLPFFLVFLIPNVLFDIQSNRGDTVRLNNFFKEYYHGFSLRFMLHKASDAMLMFKLIINHPALEWLKFIIPITFYAYIFIKEQDLQKKKIAILTIPWLLVPWWGFTLYSGPTSDYYYLLTLPVVFYILLYFHEQLLLLNKKIIIPILLIIWTAYTWINTEGLLIKPNQGGLEATKAEVRKGLQEFKKYPYNEGDIKSYLVTIWNDDAIKKSTDKPTVSIVNTVRSDTDIQSPHAFNHAYGHYATWLWQFSALEKKELTDYALKYMKDEQHAVLLEIDEATANQAKIEFKGNLLSQYSQQEKKQIIEATFEKFKLIFGYHAEVIGVPEINASDVTEIRKKYGIKAVAIINKSFTGNPDKISTIPDRNNLTQNASSFDTSTKVIITQLIQYSPETIESVKSKHLNDPRGHIIISNELPNYNQAVQTISTWKDSDSVEIKSLYDVAYKRLIKKQI